MRIKGNFVPPLWLWQRNGNPLMIFLLGFGFIHYWRFYHLQGLINSKPELDSTVTVFLTVSSIIYYQYLFCCFIFYIFWGVGRVEVLGGNSCQICFFPYMTICFCMLYHTELQKWWQTETNMAAKGWESVEISPSPNSGIQSVVKCLSNMT